MFFLLMLLFGIYFAAKLYAIIESRYPAPSGRTCLSTC